MLHVVFYQSVWAAGRTIWIFAFAVLFPTRLDIWNTWYMMLGSKLFIQEVYRNILFINNEDKEKECVIIWKPIQRKGVQSYWPALLPDLHHLALQVSQTYSTVTPHVQGKLCWPPDWSYTGTPPHGLAATAPMQQPYRQPVISALWQHQHVILNSQALEAWIWCQASPCGIFVDKMELW